MFDQELEHLRVAEQSPVGVEDLLVCVAGLEEGELGEVPLLGICQEELVVALVRDLDHAVCAFCPDSSLFQDLFFVVAAEDEVLGLDADVLDVRVVQELVPVGVR